MIDSRPKENYILKILVYALFAFIIATYIFPLVYLVNVSFKTMDEFDKNPASIAKSFLNFSNYLVAFKRGNLLLYTFNTIIYALASGIITITVCLLAAFPISRKYIKWSNFWFNLFLASLFLPSGIIPQFRLMVATGLYNTQYGYIVLKVSVGIIFFLLVGFIKFLPKELDEVASIDGCGYLRYVFTIILPLTKPALASAFILHLVAVWNDVIGGVLYFSTKNFFPAVRGLFAFYGQYGNEWPRLAAAIIIVAAPLIILYIIFQKYIIEGAVSGAIKG